MHFGRLLFTIFVSFSIFYIQYGDSGFQSLKYDVECPFLTEREYNERVEKGRCPFKIKVNSTSSPSTDPPNLKHGILVANVQKKLMKFVNLGKQRTVKIPMNRAHAMKFNAIEGSFLEIRCDLDNKKENETQVRWFFDGLPLDPSVFNWRVQSIDKNQRLLLAPTLVKYDSGLFECFVDEDFRGGIHLEVITIWRSVFIGFENYLIGMAFSLPLVIIAAAYRLYRPGQDNKMDTIFEDGDAELSLEFDEMMMRLKEAEKL